MEKLLLIDTFNFLHRAYHALPKTFKAINGEPTNAVYGVTSMLITAFAQIKPNYVVAAFESRTPTARVIDYTSYKAHRKPMEDDLSVQIPKVEEIMQAFGIKMISFDGFEADDVIATLAVKYKDEVEVIIISNDRDLWQLVSNNVLIMLPNTKGDTEWIGPKEAEARMGFPPSLIADYKGLRGDPSDNLPGVYGIGEKTAQKLLTQFDSFDNIYLNLKSVEPFSLREKLENCYEQAVMSRNLAKLHYDVPLDAKLEDCRYKEVNKLKVKEILEKYNFKSLVRRMGFEPNPDSREKAPPKIDNQLPLI